MVEKAKTVLKKHKNKLDWAWKAGWIAFIGLTLNSAVDYLKSIEKHMDESNKNTATFVEKIEHVESDIDKIIYEINIQEDDLQDHETRISILEQIKNKK